MLRPADDRDISEFEMRDKLWDRRVRLQRVLAARRPFWISGWILGRRCFLRLVMSLLTWRFRSGLQAVQRTTRADEALEGRSADLPR